MQGYWNPLQSRRRRMKSTLLLLVVTGVLFYYNWVNEAVESTHVMPQVKRCDINDLLTNQRCSDAELQTLSRQTGLHCKVIEKMLQQERHEELLAIQEIYFAPVQFEIVETTPVTISEWLIDEEGNGTEGMPLVEIKTGDILITKNSRFLGWRNGHVGLVVDAERELVLEAVMIGTKSQLCRLDKWEECPSFMVLRLREEYIGEGEQKQQVAIEEDMGEIEENWNAKNLAEHVAVYAKEHLEGIPYHLLAGIFEHETEKTENMSVLSGTQCAHLVWYAYKQFGIDLDSDGGLLVTPCDIQNSPYLEVVQSYGY